MDRRNAESGEHASHPRLMYGPQALLDLHAERVVPIYRCVVCDWETATAGRLCIRTPDCGAMVLREHHGMAKTAWLAGVAELKRRKAARAGTGATRTKAVGVDRARASDGLRAPEEREPIQSQCVGAVRAATPEVGKPPRRVSSPAPTFNSTE